MIPKENIDQILNFGVIHGRGLCRSLIFNYPNKIQKSNFNFDNISVCTVIGSDCLGQSPLLHQNLFNKIKIIEVDTYIKFITKLIEVYKYVSNNYDALPKYILYVDGLDSLLLNSIEDPESLLKFYNCKILFNTEQNFGSAGYIWPKTYSQTRYNKLYEEYNLKHKNKFKTTSLCSLNAGVFLGEKSYIMELLPEAIKIMEDSLDKGFPYGCSNDQLVLNWLLNEHYDLISIDFFNKFSLWGGEFNFYNGPSYENFKINYNQQFLNDYINSNK